MMSQSRKGPIFTEIVLEVFKLGGLLVSEGDKMGEEYGVTSARWKVLGAISLAEERQTASQIARSMGLTRQAVQRLLDAMYADGLLTFHDNPEHKRARLIGLSKSGAKVYSRLFEKQYSWAANCATSLSQKDLETAHSVLKKIASTLENEQVTAKGK